MRDVLISKGEIYNFNIFVNSFQQKHVHQEIELIYVMEGQVYLEIESEIFNLNKEDIVIINSNKRHSFRENSNCIIGSFQFSFEFISTFLNKNLILFWCNSSIDKDIAYEELRKIIKEMLNEYLKSDGEETFFQYSLVFKLLGILSNSFLVDNKDERFVELKDRYEDRIAEITNYIRRNYSKSISLTDLADQLYLSTAYLSRFFKKHIGMNFIDYVNGIRLHYAIDDLLYSNKSITRIALDNGFASSTVFNKVFKEEYDMAPSTYQKKMRENSSENIEYKSVLNKEEIKDILNNYFGDYIIENDGNIEKINKYIIVDAKDTYKIKNHWNKIINIGNASEILKSDVQEHILILKEKLYFQYVRFWSIFDEDMYIDINSESGNYNFNKIDRVLDFLVSNNIKPFIEFANKGKRIHKSVNNEIVRNGNKQSFTSLKQWSNVIEKFIIHIMNRYGIDEVEKWYCEIMKLEVISGIDRYSEKDNYMDIFEISYLTIKKYLPNMKVGGAGINIDYSKKSLAMTLNECINSKVKPDFLSLYFYPYNTDGEYSKRSTDKNYVINKISELKGMLHRTFNFKEIIISEWNCTVSNRSFINDSCYKGAYMVKHLIDSVNEVDMLGYWLGTDLFGEFHDTRHILNGGAGLLTKDGIRKPSFYGIDFMNHLGNKLIEKGENYIVTSNNSDYKIVCHNYKHPNYYYYLKEEDVISPLEQYKIFDDNDTIKLNFQINNVNNGKYTIKKYSLSRSNGSILDEWIKMNFTDDINKSEINYLKDICKPRLSIKNSVVTDGRLNIEVVLSPHEINRIEIKYKY